MQRSLLVFENAIKSEFTKNNYLKQLGLFLKWSKIKDHDSLLKVPNDQLQIMLEDYLFHLKKTVSPNSIPVMFAGIELFFVMNDKNLNFKKIRKMFPEKIKKAGFKSYTTEDIQKMLSFSPKKRTRALILFYISTGCRVGSIPELKLKHLSEMDHGCKHVLFYEGTQQESDCFLTPEASKALDDYFEERRSDGEKLTEESPIFRRIYQFGAAKVIPATTSSLTNVIYRTIERAGIQRVKHGNRFNIQLDHGFRKWYNSILKSNNLVNTNWAEKLLGHKKGLDGAYLTNDRDKAFKEFEKAIQDLTIDPTERLKAEKERLQDELSEKDKLKQELKNQRQEIDMLKDLHYHHVSLIKAIREDPEFAKALRDGLLHMKSEEGKVSVF